MKFDLNCKKHPRYKAKIAPIVECGACWILYHLRWSRVYVTNITELDRRYESTLVDKSVSK